MQNTVSLTITVDSIRLSTECQKLFCLNVKKWDNYIFRELSEEQKSILTVISVKVCPHESDYLCLTTCTIAVFVFSQ